MYNSYERVKAALGYKTLDRITVAEDLCPDAIKRLQKEGLPVDVDITVFLGIDAIGQIIPFDDELSSAFPRIVYEDSDEYAYKPAYGEKIFFFGNISADAIASGNREAIEKEVRTKVLAVKEAVMLYISQRRRSNSNRLFCRLLFCG